MLAKIYQPLTSLAFVVESELTQRRVDDINVRKIWHEARQKHSFDTKNPYFESATKKGFMTNQALRRRFSLL